MKKINSSKYIPHILFLLLFGFNSATAQHDHSTHDHSAGGSHEHKADPPHGGVLKDIGKYHLEVVFEPMVPEEKLNVYILKASLKTATIEGVSGTVQLNYKDGSHKEYTLQALKNEKLFCTPTDMVQPFVCIITIKIKDKLYTANAEYKGFGK